ncbi:MAG: amino acid adenylation domain-containing protein [Acutalibacteraceae bacterium]
MKNILEMLECSVGRFPDKYIFRDENTDMTYAEFLNTAKSIGTNISEYGIINKPIAVIAERSVGCLAAMFGVLYSGNFYTVIDSEMPPERVKAIFKTLNPAAAVVTEGCLSLLQRLEFGGRVINYEKARKYPADSGRLSEIREKIIDTDPAYALFTSGSTGVPKGAVVSHRAVLSYVKWYADTFKIDESTVFGSQTPFYFSMSVSDVFSTVYAGAELNIIPKALFSFPMKLLELLNERRVNTIYWVPSALCIIANWRVLDYGELKYIKKVLFAGEVMPTRQLNYWISKLPDAMFANLFGPTETTDICTYYIVDRKFGDGETLPIGRACDNCDVFVVKEDGTRAKTGEEGELYARGSFLAMGYYNNPEKTAAAFVQNPLNTAYPETVYKTGDLVKYNEKGELIYISRIDFQIKHMGYRIELGEIEAAASALDGVSSCAAVYNAAEDKIILVYEGKKREITEILSELREKLPEYMMPQTVRRIKAMPHNANGKIDRKLLKNNLEEI